MGLEDRANKELIKEARGVRRRKRILALSVGTLFGGFVGTMHVVHNQPLEATVVETLKGFALAGLFVYCNPFRLRRWGVAAALACYYWGMQKRERRIIHFALVEKERDPLRKLELEAILDVREGAYDGAMRKVVKLLDIEQTYHDSRPLLERMIRAATKRIMPFVQKRNDEEKTSRALYYALGALHAGKEEEARKLLKQGVEREQEHKMEMRCLYAYFLTLTGRREDARKEWKEVAREVMQGERFRVERLGKTRNEVFEVAAEGFFRDMFIFKKGDERMVEEFRITNGVYHIVRDANAVATDEVKIAQPLGIGEVDGKVYYIVRRHRERTVDEVVRNMQNPTEKEEVVKRVLESQAALHALVTNNMVIHDEGGMLWVHRGQIAYSPIRIERYNYEKEVQRRFVERMGDNERKSEFLEAYTRLRQRMLHPGKGADSFCHGDAYPENALADGTLIDFERATIASPSLDVACLLDDPHLQGVDKERLASTHRNRVEQVSEGRLQAQALQTTWIPNRIHNLICQIGSKLAQGKRELAQFFVGEALDILSQEDPKGRAAVKEYIGKSPYASILLP